MNLDPEIRTVICTTNAIESVNARLRRAVRARGHFPTERAALKCLYLALIELDPTGTAKARWIRRWKPALNAFEITFHGRLTNGMNWSKIKPQLHRKLDSPAPRAGGSRAPALTSEVERSPPRGAVLGVPGATTAWCCSYVAVAGGSKLWRGRTAAHYTRTDHGSALSESHAIAGQGLRWW